MRRKTLISIIIAISFIAAGCSGPRSDSPYYEEVKESEDYILPIRDDDDSLEEEIQENIFGFDSKYGPEYEVDVWKVDGVGSPAGILCREQDILISDSKNDCLIVADYDGNVLRTIGKSGNGPLEFLSPGDMTAYDDKIYIIDQKNYRVQVLDADLNYADEIEARIVDRNDPEFVFEHIAVNKNGVYLSGFSFFNDHVYLYEAGGEEPVIIGKNFYGPLFCYEENIYATNTQTKVYVKKEDTIRYRNGLDNYLLLVDDMEKDFSQKTDLMPLVDATAFLMGEEEIVTASPSSSCLFAFDKHGDYKYTLAYIEGMGGESLCKLAADSLGRYYVTVPGKGSIFCCTPKE